MCLSSATGWITSNATEASIISRSFGKIDWPSALSFLLYQHAKVLACAARNKQVLQRESLVDIVSRPARVNDARHPFDQSRSHQKRGLAFVAHLFKSKVVSVNHQRFEIDACCYILLTNSLERRRRELMLEE